MENLHLHFRPSALEMLMRQDNAKQRPMSNFIFMILRGYSTSSTGIQFLIDVVRSNLYTPWHRRLSSIKCNEKITRN